MHTTFVAAVVAVVLGAVLWAVVRGKAQLIARGPGSVEDRVHRLRRLTRGTSVGGLLLGVIVGSVALGRLDGSLADKITRWICYVFCVLVIGLAPGRGARPEIARLRDVPVRVAGRWRQVVAAVLLYSVYGVVIYVGLRLAPHHGRAHVVGVTVAYGLALVLTQAAAPLLLRVNGATSLPSEVAARLQPLADRVGAGSLRLRMLPDRGQKLANAAQMGIVPGLRYVVFTGYAVERMTPDELDAVAAHEFGHGREQHLLIKLGAVLLAYGVIEALVAAADSGGGSSGAALLGLVGLPVALLGVAGLTGLRLETRADDVAAHEVGAAHLASALARLGELNHTPQRTGAAWNLFHGHPGLAQRIARLEATAPAGRHR